MLRPRLAHWITISLVLALGPQVGADERVEKTLTLDEAIPRGRPFVIENLIGSVKARGTGERGRARIEAVVVVEAKTREEAQQIADSIVLTGRDQNGGRRVQVAYPVERHTAFRLPRSEASGLLAKWVSPLLKRDGLAVEYDGHSVQVGPGRDAAAVAVHLTVSLPFETLVTVKQFVGTIHGVGLRGKLSFEVLQGSLLVEQSYGVVHARTGDGEISVSSFRGDELNVQTSSGKVELLGVQAKRVQMRTGSGLVKGSDIDTGNLLVETQSGNVELSDLESATFAVSTDSGSVDLAPGLARTREASVRSTSGNVTLRIGELSYFNLLAETRSGSVKTQGVDLQVVEQTDGASRLRRGAGGTDLRITTSEGELTVKGR